MENSIKSSATNLGLYLGGGLAAITILTYAAYLDLLTKWWFGILMAIVIIAVGIYSVAKSKGLQNGIISFKEAFGSYFLTVIIGLLISTVVTYVLFNIIDPDAAETLKQKTIEASINMMEGFRTPPEVVAEAVDQMEKTDNFSLGNIAKSMAIQIAFFGVIGLIASLVMKKTEE